MFRKLTPNDVQMICKGYPNHDKELLRSPIPGRPISATGPSPQECYPLCGLVPWPVFPLTDLDVGRAVFAAWLADGAGQAGAHCVGGVHVSLADINRSTEQFLSLGTYSNYLEHYFECVSTLHYISMVKNN